ncbi:Probable serine/threonine-protein kinase PBL18 [Linum perenne]
MEFDELSEYASFRSFPGYARRIRPGRLQRISATPRIPITLNTATSFSSFDPSSDSATYETSSGSYSYPTTASSNKTPDSASDASASADNSMTCWHSNSAAGDGIALQRILLSRRQGNPNSFGGLSSLISRCEHIGIVELLKVSIPGVRIFLVYNFVNAKFNVASQLRKSMKDPNSTALTTWISRLEIAADVARGLDNIHNTKGLSGSLIGAEIVKTTSIIIVESASISGDRPNQLESNKIRLPTSEVQEIDAGAAVANQRSDVYAYGGLILELIVGEEPMETVIEVARAVVDGRVLKWMWKDRRMEDSFPDEITEKLLRIAVDCLNEDPKKRPEIASVAGNIYRLCLETKRWCDDVGREMWHGLHQRAVADVSLAMMMDDMTSLIT